MKNTTKFDQLPSSEQRIDSEVGSCDQALIAGENLEASEIAVSDSTSNVLHRSLSFFDGLGIIVGIIIGSGIFSSPGLALQRSGSPGACLFAWSASGMLVCLTSQCYFELGSMMPTAGGDFDYLGRAYGSQAAFSFAWFNFFISKTGSQAIIATVFGRYFESVYLGVTFDLEESAAVVGSARNGETSIAKLAAMSCIVFFVLLNCAGVRESALLQRFLTSLKLLLVVILFMVAMVFVTSDSSVFEQNLSIEESFKGTKGFTGFFSAMIACLWSFDGWADLNFLMEEIVHPEKQLPRIVLCSLCIVTTAYLLANVAYFSVLDTTTIMQSKSIAVDFGRIVGNKIGGGASGAVALATVFALGVVVSTAGSNNGSIMTGGRAFYAVARGGDAPRWMASLNSAGAPWAALLAQGSWSLVLLMLPGSSFASLLDYFGPASWCFYALSSSALITLRIREPNADRPYKVPFYPLPPLLVIAIAIMVVTSSLLKAPLYCSLALGFVTLSIPVHTVVKRYFPAEDLSHQST